MKFYILFPLKLITAVFVSFCIFIGILILLNKLEFSFYYLLLFPAFFYYLFLQYKNVYIDNDNNLIVENIFYLLSKKREKVQLGNVKEIKFYQNKPTLDLIIIMTNQTEVIIPTLLSVSEIKKIKAFILKHYPNIQFVN